MNRVNEHPFAYYFALTSISGFWPNFNKNLFCTGQERPHRIHTDFVCSFDPACPLKIAGNAETPCLTCRRWRRNSPQKRDRIHWVWGVKDRFTQFFLHNSYVASRKFLCAIFEVWKKNFTPSTWPVCGAQHGGRSTIQHRRVSQDMPSVGQCSKWFAASAAFLQWICPVCKASWAALRNIHVTYLP